MEGRIKGMDPEYSPSVRPSPAKSNTSKVISPNHRSGALRVAVVDDEELVRETLRRALKSFPGVECVGVFESGWMAVEQMPSLDAELVLMDVQMPGMCGIQCTRRLLAREPWLRIIMVTAKTDDSVLEECDKAGAIAYLVKPVTLQQLFAAIRFWSRTDSVQAAAQRPGGEEGVRIFPKALCHEEEAVLKCFADGLLYKEISLRLRITPSKLRKVQHRLFAKMGMYNRHEAARCWKEWLQIRSKLL